MKFIRVLKAEKIKEIDPARTAFNIARSYIVEINKHFTNIDEELSKMKNIMSSTVLSFVEENKDNEYMDATYSIYAKFGDETFNYHAGDISIYAAFAPYDSGKEPKPLIEAYSEDKKFMNVNTNNIEQLAKKLNYALDVIAQNIKSKAEREQRYLNDEY